MVIEKTTNNHRLDISDSNCLLTFKNIVRGINNIFTYTAGNKWCKFNKSNLVEFDQTTVTIRILV